MTDVYCGPAPTPQTLLWAWNLDLAAIGLCAAIVIAHRLRADRDGRGALAFAVAVLAVLFLSPLCALSAALFSARAVHHVLLVTLAALLLALAFPLRRQDRPRPDIGWVAGLNAAIFWLWHAPPLYAAAVGTPALYWLMQLSLLGSAVWLWRRILDPREAAGGAVFSLLGMTVQMGLLGALLTFASVPLYRPHLLTTVAFGLAPIDDQQLAGLVMWVPAALPYLAAALYRCWPMLGLASPSRTAS